MGATQAFEAGVVAKPTAAPSPVRIARVAMFKAGTAMNATFGTPIALGDLIICAMSSYQGTVHTAPAGWTQVHQNAYSADGGASMRNSIWARFADAAIVAAGHTAPVANFSTGNQTSGVGICDVWRGAAMPADNDHIYSAGLITAEDLALPVSTYVGPTDKAVTFAFRGFFGAGPAPFFVGGGIDDLHTVNSSIAGYYASVTTLAQTGPGNTPATPRWDANGTAGARTALHTLVIPPA